MKIYDLKNKKLYESNAVYTLSVEEFDANGNSIDQNSFEETYSTLEDALEDSYDLMSNCAGEEGYDEDDVEYVQNEDNVVFSTPDGKKWVFTANVSNNECEIVESGDMGESEKTNEDITIPNPYYGNETTTQDSDVSSRAISSSSPNLTRDDVEAFWLGGVPRGVDLSNFEPNKAYDYFIDYLLDPILVYAPVRDGSINPQYLENIMVSMVNLFTFEGRIWADFVKKAISAIVKGIGIDTSKKEYRDVIGDFLDDLDESLKESKNESVAERFSRLRKMFESDNDQEDDEVSDEDVDNGDETSDEDKSDDEKADDEKTDDEESDEDDLMKAVIITVKKGDEEKAKEEMIDAGISEDDIEILDADDDAENVEIRVDVNSIMELKDYLNKKGIDLEEEIGGEIVSDDEESDDDSDDKDSDDENGDEEDFDFDNIGDLFGADETEE